MRIQHNIAALNSYRQLGSNNTSVSKNLEKLSSGYRINRAGDDAAGLAISEKMRAQITGLETASKNANDGISLVQTAEGALTEVHSMLNRMVELADQSANGTYQDAVDRENLQKEVSSLKNEIDRISEGTNFNGINLLDGSLSGGTAAAAKSVKIANATTTDSTAAAGVYTASAAVTSAMASTETDGSKFNYTITYKDNADGTNKSLDFSLTLATNESGDKVLVGGSGKSYSIADFTGAGAVASDIDKALANEIRNSALGDKFDMTLNTGAAFAFTAKEDGSAGAVITGITERTTTNNGTVSNKTLTTTVTTSAADSYKQLAASGVTAYSPASANLNDATFTVNGQKFVFTASGTDVSGIDKNITVLFDDAGGGEFTADNAKTISQKTGLNVTEDGSGNLTFKPSSGKVGSGGMTLLIGDTADDFNKLTVSVESMSAKSLGIGSIDVSTQDGATSAVQVIKDAINKVSSTRGDLGALQNRLEHTINNLGVTTENMTAAESRIRDVDMAKEMMNYTKNNILVQASQSMLAQANQTPQGVLQLLK